MSDQLIVNQIDQCNLCAQLIPLRVRHELAMPEFQPAVVTRKDHMSKIIVEHNPPASTLDTMGVAKWPTWTKEVSVFPWTFHEQEIAYILEGECVITPEGGSPVTFGKGDLVTFPAGINASWEVKQPLHKHYKLEGTALSQAFRRIKAKLKF